MKNCECYDIHKDAEVIEDSCGCCMNDHQSVPTPPQSADSWNFRYENLYESKILFEYGSRFYKAMESFISQEIETAKQEEREAIAKWIENENIQFPYNKGEWDEAIEAFKRAAYGIRHLPNPYKN